MSWEESSRLDPMGLRDLGLVRPDERAAAYDVLTTDDQLRDAMRPREHERGDEILRAAELQAVRAPDREVGALAWDERADVVAAQHGGSAARPEPERFSRGHCARPATATGYEERLLDLQEEVAALVGRRAVDAETDADAGVHEILHPRDTCT